MLRQKKSDFGFRGKLHFYQSPKKVYLTQLVPSAFYLILIEGICLDATAGLCPDLETGTSFNNRTQSW